MNLMQQGMTILAHRDRSEVRVIATVAFKVVRFGSGPVFAIAELADDAVQFMDAGKVLLRGQVPTSVLTATATWAAFSAHWLRFVGSLIRPA